MAKTQSQNDVLHLSESEKRRNGIPLEKHHINVSPLTEEERKAARESLFLNEATKQQVAKRDEQMKVDKAREYNRRLAFGELDPRYTDDIEMTGYLLVRMFCMEPVNKAGIYIDVSTVPIPKSKPGDFDLVHNPYSFKPIGVIVNRGNLQGSYNVGDIVQIDPKILVPGLTTKKTLFLDREFVRWDAEDILEYGEDWGYIKVFPRDIEAKVKKLVPDESDKTTTT